MTEFENSIERDSRKSFPTRLLGRLGFVYGEDGLAEFGMQKTGWGLPLYRRSTLEAAQASARRIVEASMAEDVYQIPHTDTSERD